MKYDKVTIIGVTACVLAFFLMAYFLPRPTRPAPQPDAGEQQVGTTTPAPETTTPAAPAPTPAAPVAPAPLSLREPWPAPSQPPVALVRPDEAVAMVAPDGGGIAEVVLDHYVQDKPQRGKTPPEKVVLGHYDYPFLALVQDPAGLNLDSGATVTSQTETELTITRQSTDKRLQVTETWATFPEGTYEWRYTVTVSNLGDSSQLLPGLRLEAGALPPSVSPNRKASRGEAAGGAAIGLFNESKTHSFDLKSLSKLSLEKQSELAMLPTQWTAVHSKYFLFALWSFDQPLVGVDASAVPSIHQEGVPTHEYGRCRLRAILSGPVTLPPGESKTWTVGAYAGPKNYHRLHGMKNGLDTIMDMNRFFFWRPAWMGFLSRVLLDGMVWISGLFPASIGWGMGIICLTLLVKLLFWPLSHKSTVSMRRMQALQPQLKELREKYKDDPTKMYRKQQELFKEHKVSQFGGCLPMLFQIPVFFALFNTFRNAVELRHAGFLWAFDLSMPDTLAFSPSFLPIRPLALLMGATMYWQQKITPSPDPQQAKMMNMMTVFFMVLFYGMPSALTLYMTVNYVLGILQTIITRKLEARKQPA
ncbi:MAG TPA: membrane protein insertase YidC [Lentisphaeria bacterium]|nr:membrane protein insertase YidC [Lentisphaerota bacterium]OQC16981.1 MAG: Membrane protein insertase YidC [Lentisphaerae bacterium ADurb.Bin082]HPY90913.1 membrane protein insertase YidC [Lentisphaeria bacterium]